ncbi:MAG: hypothetical protein J0L66_02265 [Cytophagales bacterium]|nr:hypothetical protein [Cytophagales bacterium]
MRHQIKSWIFKTLEWFPEGAGNWMYHQLQRINENSLKDEYTFQVSTLNRFADILSQHHLLFKDKVVVELGSGWLPVVPYELILIHNAARVLTFDINQHYSDSKIKQLSLLYNSLYGFNLSPGLLPNVHYYPKTNILNHKFESAVDVFLSRNVLEHVAPADLYEIHQQMFNSLHHNSFVIHQISPSDHRAYTDRSLSLWDFLRYSQEEWDKIQTRFDYHNRWRLPHYIGMFKQCGFEVMYCSFKSHKADQKLPDKIHKEFGMFTLEELTAGNILIILKKK